MARNKFDVDEKLESPFQWSHLKMAGKYVGKHKYKMLLALLLSGTSRKSHSGCWTKRCPTRIRR